MARATKGGYGWRVVWWIWTEESNRVNLAARKAQYPGELVLKRLVIGKLTADRAWSLFFKLRERLRDNPHYAGGPALYRSTTKVIGTEYDDRSKLPHQAEARSAIRVQAGRAAQR